jgi:hypothetical protein
MSLRIRFHFDGKCARHPRYNPNRDGGQPEHGKCEGCKTLHVIALYSRIAKRRADKAEGIVVRTPTRPGEQSSSNESAPTSDSDS